MLFSHDIGSVAGLYFYLYLMHKQSWLRSAKTPHFKEAANRKGGESSFPWNILLMEEETIMVSICSPLVQRPLQPTVSKTLQISWAPAPCSPSSNWNLISAFQTYPKPAQYSRDGNRAFGAAAFRNRKQGQDNSSFLWKKLFPTSLQWLWGFQPLDHGWGTLEAAPTDPQGSCQHFAR